MNKSLLKYRISACVVGMLLTLAWMSSCAENQLNFDTEVSKQSLLQINTRSLIDGSDSENALRTLRLIIFQSDGKLLLNKKYNTDDASLQAPDNSYDYFLKTADSYLFSQMLPKVSINVFLVANEMTTVLDKVQSEEDIKKARLNYGACYTNEKGAMDIVVDNAPTKDYPNRGFIPMYAESGVMTPHQWSASNGKEVQMPLVRALAKVVLQLKNGAMTGLTHPDDKITIKSASLVHIPLSCLLGDLAAEYEETLVSAATRSFSTPLVITNGMTDEKKSDMLTFYMPEYIISQGGVDAKGYAYVQINAIYESGDTKDEINSTYRIPIGNGVDVFYLNGGGDLSTLTRKDLIVSRNTLYNIEATVTTKGKLEIYQIETEIVPWANPIEVNGDIHAPVLNVTSLQVNMSAHSVRVHFWTNQPNPYVAESGTAAGVPANVNELFKELHGPEGTSTTHFKLFSEADNPYLPYNGYIDFQFKENDRYSIEQVYTVTLNAGGLKRVISVMGNPVVGEVIFSANGGTGENYKIVLRYNDLTGQELMGAKVLLAGPTGFTPPDGMSFLGWSDAVSGAFMEEDAASGKYNIILSGYSTRLNAWWK